MKVFGLAAILGVLTLGLVIGLLTGERVQANHIVTHKLYALYTTIFDACKEVRENPDRVTGQEIEIFGIMFTVVKDAGQLSGRDKRSTGRRDILVSTSTDSEEVIELSGGKGDDILCGGPGPDTLNGGSGNDYALGGPCDVTRCWTQPPNQIIDDTFNGGGGNDHFFGEDGNDFLNGGGNNDTLDGGKGNDEAWGGVGTSPAALWPWLSPFMRGGSGDDFLIGREGNDDLHGGSGDDVLIGGFNLQDQDNEDFDKLHGGNHNDDLYGGSNATFNGDWHQDYCLQVNAIIMGSDSCEEEMRNQGDN